MKLKLNVEPAAISMIMLFYLTLKRSDIKYNYSLVPPSPLKPPMKTFLDTSQSLKENMYYSIPVSSKIGVNHTLDVS